MNPVDLFTLQQQQIQLQQQLDMQNYAAMAAVAAAQQQQLEQQHLQNNDDDEECEEEEVEEDLQTEEYGENSYQYDATEGSDDPENNALNEDYSSNSNSSFLLSQQQQMFNLVNAATHQQLQHHNNLNKNSKESFKKIKPVKRPGLVLKTPIAYQGNVDPSVIPIQREGMGRSRKAHLNFFHFILFLLFYFYFFPYFLSFFHLHLNNVSPICL